jgi:hypothetical protein
VGWSGHDGSVAAKSKTTGSGLAGQVKLYLNGDKLKDKI